MARFKPGDPGGPGRKPGGKNRKTKEREEFAKALVNDPQYQASLRERLLAGKAPQVEVLILQYAYGKPKDVVKHEGKGGDTTVRVMFGGRYKPDEPDGDS